MALLKSTTLLSHCAWQHSSLCVLLLVALFIFGRFDRTKGTSCSLKCSNLCTESVPYASVYNLRLSLDLTLWTPRSIWDSSALSSAPAMTFRWPSPRTWCRSCLRRWLLSSSAGCSGSLSRHRGARFFRFVTGMTRRSLRHSMISLRSL